MKILCLWPLNNKTADNTLFKKSGDASCVLGQSQRFAVAEKPESALIRAGQPFFVPDWSATFDVETMLAVRIDRLGRYIAPRFASRYYTQATAALAFTARDLLERLRADGQPWDLALGFDQSVALGRFADAATVIAQAGHRCLPADVDEGVALCSRFYTLKSGDLLLFSLGLEPQTVSEGDVLSASIGSEQLLTLRIK